MYALKTRNLLVKNRNISVPFRPKHDGEVEVVILFMNIFTSERI